MSMLKEIAVKTSGVGAVRKAHRRYVLDGLESSRRALVQEILKAVEVEGMTYKELSLKLGMSTTWANMTVRNARLRGLV